MRPKKYATLRVDQDSRDRLERIARKNDWTLVAAGRRAVAALEKEHSRARRGANGELVKAN